jgi:hypothetical protein
VLPQLAGTQAAEIVQHAVAQQHGSITRQKKRYGMSFFHGRFRHQKPQRRAGGAFDAMRDVHQDLRHSVSSGPGKRR